MILPFIVSIVIVQTMTPAVVTVAQGAQSGIDSPSEAVVRSQAEWQALWKAHAGLETPPAVDFSRDLVAAVFLGMRRTGGFRVEIVGARRDGSTLVIEFVERVPAPGSIVTQALTSPFHIVRLERFDGPVRFRKMP